MRAILLSLLILAGSAQLSKADIRLPKLVGDNMVLQRDMPVHIWGWADPGEKIDITFGGKSYGATADAAGNWKATLKKMKAGGPYRMTLSAGNRIELKNILIGDVWVCSGQSNMEWPLEKARNPEEEIKNAAYPKI
ncbi:MAG TPA: sialate O-acetylesterase, partial [Anseongella sp.]|nr:sialate O-acetylesterase [Anseongella sp.]